VLPPFVGVAVNVTVSPEHIVVDEADIETDGVTEGLMVKVVAITLSQPFTDANVS